MSETNPKPAPQGPKGPDLNEFADALMGWQTTFFRTIFTGILKPERVAEAALASDTSRFAPPLRLFVFLFGSVMAVTAFISPDTLSNIENFLGLPAEVIETWLAENRTVTLADINSTWQTWYSFLIWVMTVVSSAPYILLFKAYDTSRTLYGAALVYLVTTNSMLAVQIVLQTALAALLPTQANIIITTAFVLLFYIYIAARVIVNLYARTTLGAIFKVAGMVAMTPISLFLTGILQFVALLMVLQFGFDISMVDITEFQ